MKARSKPVRARSRCVWVDRWDHYVTMAHQRLDALYHTGDDTEELCDDQIIGLLIHRAVGAAAETTPHRVEVAVMHPGTLRKMRELVRAATEYLPDISWTGEKEIAVGRAVADLEGLL